MGTMTHIPPGTHMPPPKVEDFDCCDNHINTLEKIRCASNQEKNTKTHSLLAMPYLLAADSCVPLPKVT